MLVITSNSIGHTSHLSQVLCESKPTDAPYANAIGWQTHTQTKHNIPLPKYRHATQLPTITQTRKHAYAHARTCMRVQCNKIFTCTHVCNPCPCACPRAGTRKQMHTHLNLNTFKNYTCMHVCVWKCFVPTTSCDFGLQLVSQASGPALSGWQVIGGNVYTQRLPMQASVTAESWKHSTRQNLGPRTHILSWWPGKGFCVELPQVHARVQVEGGHAELMHAMLLPNLTAHVQKTQARSKLLTWHPRT